MTPAPRRSMLGACLFLTISLLAVSSILAAANPGIDVSIALPDHPVAVGEAGQALVTITPPAGIKLNRYPPIRVTLEDKPPVKFDSTTVKVGLDQMPDDLEQNHFDRVDPIPLKFKVGQHTGDGKIPITGKLRFTYCVAKSGFCAPLTKDLAFEVPVTAR